MIPSGRSNDADREWIKMDDITHTKSTDGILKNAAPRVEEDVYGNAPEQSGSAVQAGEAEETRERGWRKKFGRNRQSYSHQHYKVYKRRWFGLAQLVLLNIVASWDVGCSFSLLQHNVSLPVYHVHDLSLGVPQ
jgi:hypothetical protein